MINIISKEFTFDSAHQLVGHKGKCANLHGHTYRVKIYLQGTIKTKRQDPSAEGMIEDFGDVTEVAKPLIDALDHAFLAQGNEPVYPHVTTKQVLFGFRTTAENMASFILWYLRTYGDKRYFKVELWETPTGCAVAEVTDEHSNFPLEDKFRLVHFHPGGHPDA